MHEQLAQDLCAGTSSACRKRPECHVCGAAYKALLLHPTTFGCAIQQLNCNKQGIRIDYVPVLCNFSLIDRKSGQSPSRLYYIAPRSRRYDYQIGGKQLLPISVYAKRKEKDLAIYLLSRYLDTTSRKNTPALVSSLSAADS